MKAAIIKIVPRKWKSAGARSVNSSLGEVCASHLRIVCQLVDSPLRHLPEHIVYLYFLVSLLPPGEAYISSQPAGVIIRQMKGGTKCLAHTCTDRCSSTTITSHIGSSFRNALFINGLKCYTRASLPPEDEHGWTCRTRSIPCHIRIIHEKPKGQIKQESKEFWVNYKCTG